MTFNWNKYSRCTYALASSIVDLPAREIIKSDAKT